MEEYQQGLLTDPDLAATRLGPRWWATQVLGLVLVVALMVPLAFALTMLTRMALEGVAEPELHRPTFWVWFALCVVGVLWLTLGGTWSDIKDERVHIDSTHGDLTINRWSPPHERERFRATRTAAARAEERLTAAADAEEGDDDTTRLLMCDAVEITLHRHPVRGPRVTEGCVGTGGTIGIEQCHQVTVARGIWVAWRYETCRGRSGTGPGRSP